MTEEQDEQIRQATTRARELGYVGYPHDRFLIRLLADGFPAAAALAACVATRPEAPNSAELQADGEPDPVNHPPHYTGHPSGVECIEITEHMGFCLGNALKYIWRSDLKGNAIEDLEKARFYLDREISKRKCGRFDT